MGWFRRPRPPGLFKGKTGASQASVVGSIPIARSKQNQFAYPGRLGSGMSSAGASTEHGERCPTTTSEPSARNAAAQGDARLSVNSGPYRVATSQASSHAVTGQNDQRGCSTRYSPDPPGRAM